MAEQTINKTESRRVEDWIFEMNDQNKVREVRINEVKARMNVLRDHVDEFTDLGTELQELRTEKKDSRKFLDTLISFAEKASGEDFVDDGPIFREKKGDKGK